MLYCGQLQTMNHIVQSFPLSRLADEHDDENALGHLVKRCGDDSVVE